MREKLMQLRIVRSIAHVYEVLQTALVKFTLSACYVTFALIAFTGRFTFFDLG